MTEKQTRVEKLVDEKRFLKDRLAQIETYLSSIRLRHKPEQLRKGWFMPSMHARLNPIPDDIVSEFYEFLCGRRDRHEARLRDIQAELEAPSGGKR